MRIYITITLFALQIPMLYCATCTWQGSTSTDWHTASNWSTGTIPTAADDVIINALGKTANIATGMVGECRNLTKGLFFSNFTINGLLKIHGNLTYNGGFFTGDVSFVGTGLQSIGGGSPVTLTNITVANTQGVILTGSDVKLSGNLSLQANIYTNGRFLEVAALSGYSSSVFVVSGDDAGNSNSSGGLVLNVGAGGSGFYPVGPKASTYTPATISNTAGPDEKFSVAVSNTSISTDAINSTWTVSEYTPGGNTASLTLQWDQGIEGSTFNRTNSGIYKVSGTTLVYTGYSPQTGPATNAGGTTWTQTLSGITDFSEWTVHNTTGVLPITLLNFQVFYTADHKTRAEWLIDLYSNPAYFEVEKSRDGLQFRSAMKILAQDTEVYEVDLEPEPTLHYYRLKMVDTEGEITYSKVLALDGHATHTNFSLSPNPCVHCPQLELNCNAEGKLWLRFVDVQGKTCLTKVLHLDKHQPSRILPTPTLPTGIYFVAATNEQGLTTLYKFLLE